MTKKISKYVLILLSFFAITSCQNPYKEKLVTITSRLIDFESNETGSQESNHVFAGKFYTHCDGNNQFSSGFYFPIPDSLNNCFLRICLDFQYRKGGRNFGQQMVASIQHNADILFWNVFDLNKYSQKKDVWIHVSDSTQIFYSSTVSGNEIRVFGYDVDKKSYLDIDNLQVKIKKVYTGMP